MIKHKYVKGDAVLIYHCTEFIGGGAGVIIDRDVESLSYLVADITNKERLIWIHEENMMRLHFEKPKNLLEKIRRVLND
jgi:hypothetical protein